MTPETHWYLNTVRESVGLQSTHMQRLDLGNVQTQGSEVTTLSVSKGSFTIYGSAIAQAVRYCKTSLIASVSGCQNSGTDRERVGERYKVTERK